MTGAHRTPGKGMLVMTEFRISDDLTGGRRTVSRAAASGERNRFSPLLVLVALAILLAIALFAATRAGMPFDPASVPYLSIEPSTQAKPPSAPAREAEQAALTRSPAQTPVDPVPSAPPSPDVLQPQAQPSVQANVQTSRADTLQEDAAAAGLTARRTAASPRDGQ